MAEAAAGAVTSLLRVIRSEARLLRLVWSDVKFIKEEMESMNSFLEHLARSAPADGEHDEQVRTWMNQVRLLVRDCNNCIDLYLYWDNPDVYRARGCLCRCLWWVYWFQTKLVAQHHAAVQLRELKDRVRIISERRLRYGVEVPSNSAMGQSHPASRLMSAALSAAAAGGYAAAADEDEEDGDHDQFVAVHHSGRALLSRTLDDYVKAKILEWRNTFRAEAGKTMSMAIVMAPDADEDLDALSLAYENMVFHPGYTYSRGYHLAVLIDIPALHPESYSPLRPKEVLFYILRQLKLQSQKQGTDQVEEVLDFWQVYRQKCHIYFEKKTVLCEIKEKIENMRIYEKLDEIKRGLKTLRPNSQEHSDMDHKDPDVHVLLKQLLPSYMPASQQDQLMKNKGLPKLSASDDTIVAVAKKLKEYMEAVEQGGVQNEAVEEDRGGKENVQVRGGGEIVEEERGGKGIAVQVPGGGANDNDDEDAGSYRDDDNGGEEETKIYLHEDQYVHILRQVFPKIITSNKFSAMQATNTMLGEDQIKQMINESKQEILRELQEAKHDRIQEAGQNTEAIFLEIVDQKMAKIKHEFKEQLKIKGLVDDIKCQLKKKCPLFILKIDETVDLPRLEDTRNALALLGCSADVLILTTGKDIQQANEYCYPQTEPIDYSLAGLYYDIVLKITKQQKNEKNYDPKIFRNILEQCQPNEFCMKIFTHALYVNPRRSNEELNKLHRILHDSPKSSDIIAKTMFMFSYTDMPREYKSCLLYLAIFPPGYKIRRSTLIGRWVAEGLIFKEDWRSSVHRANRCFDELISRCLADPADTNGATGKVKSCVLGDLVHGFITKIARKQHIVETRLSHHLARHFSIFNDLQLRRSDKIDSFFHGLSMSSQVSLLKVLDLEGCQCFGGKNQRYLEDICSKMLLLKYLSLRGTDVTQLPSKINNLRELEVLDIRQTNLPMNATANVLLLKLKRLLAGSTDGSPRPTLGAEELVSTAVQIPHKIQTMVNVEVLFKVKAQSNRDLKSIGKLWQLRKLGVVVDDDYRCLRNLLRAISDQHECLCSLSITLQTTTTEATAFSEVFPQSLKYPPKLLESLSISGTTQTQQKHILPLFIKDVDNNLLSKLTLSCTSLNQNNLDVLAMLPKLQSIRLRHIAFTDIESLIFKKEEFRYLKYLLVEGSSFTKISFEDEAACMLDKIALVFTNIESVSGVDSLQKLEEVELSMNSSNKNNNMLLSSFNNGKQLAKLRLVGMSLKHGDQQIQNTITFNKGEFLKLRLLTVDCSAITEVVFTSGSAPKLEKIVWSSSTSLSGINNLPKLKELEFNGYLVPEVVKEASKNHKNKPNLKHNKQEIQDRAGDEEEDDEDAARLSLF